ncbi:MAG: Hsp20/alpha crystallin family protein [Candidatus Parcubacteria bacterium]|nr:Hsp20/alpha crystallin family protein [Candidatus Parcubacteria bacterium]
MEDKTPVFFTSFDDLKQKLKDDQYKDQSVFSRLNKDELEPEANWFNEDYEGELSVDVYQEGKNLVVKAAIAGVKPEDLEIYIHNDLLTIRGKRESEEEETTPGYFYQECYWGGFSRSILLPVEVQVDSVEAILKNGILKIVMPIANRSKLVNVNVKVREN